MNRLEQKDFNGIMMKNTRFRLSADPTIGVADLMAPLDNYMVSKGDSNILNMVRPPTGVTQKTAPDLLWLKKNYQLYLEYAKVAPNSMIPPRKHRTALERLDRHTKCNFTKATTEDWADQVDQAIRLAMKQFRDLKNEVIFRERAFRRVDSVVQKNIQKVLDHLTKVDKESHFDNEDSQHQGEDKSAAKPNFLAIMDGNHTPDEPPKKKVTLSPPKLFQTILDKQEAEPEDLEEEARTPPLTATSSKTPHEEDRPALRKLKPFFSPVTPDTKEEDMIKDAQNQGPIENIRQKKIKKKKTKDKDKDKSKQKPGKAKPRGKANPKKIKKKKKKNTQKEEAKVAKKHTAAKIKLESKEKHQQEQENPKKEPIEEAKPENEKPMKRPAAGIKTSGHPVQWEKEPEPVVNEKWFEGMMDMVKEGRTKAKHKIESRAHHSEEYKWKKYSKQFTDEDHEEFSRRRKLARDLCKQEFDKRWLPEKDKPYEGVEPKDVD